FQLYKATPIDRSEHQAPEASWPAPERIERVYPISRQICRRSHRRLLIARSQSTTAARLRRGRPQAKSGSQFRAGGMPNAPARDWRRWSMQSAAKLQQRLTGTEGKTGPGRSWLLEGG